MSTQMGPGYNKLTGKKKMRKYDFHRPDKFSRENLGALRVLHDNLARLLATNLSAHVRTAVSVSLVAIDQVTYDEFVEQLQRPVILGMTRFEPLEGQVGIEICPNIAYPLIERLLGSPQEAGVMDRALTDIEAAVLKTAFEKILDGIEEAWQGVCELEGKLDSIETSPFFTQFAPPNEMMMLAGFLVEMGNYKDRINIAWPYIMLEPVLPDLSVQHWMGRAAINDEEAADDNEERVAIEKQMEDVTVELVAELGECKVTVRELLGLNEGDVLQLKQRIDRPIKILSGDRTILWGQPGHVGSRFCVRVTSSRGKERSNVEGNSQSRRN